MFEIKLLDAPETLPILDGAGTITLTHSCTVGAFDPRSKSLAVLVTETKGYLDGNGEYQAFEGAAAVRSTLDAEGLAALLADTTGGKPAGAFRTTDILPAIAKRRADKEAAAEAKAKAAQEAESEERTASGANLKRP